MTFQSFLPFTPETENNFNLTTTELITQALSELRVGIEGEGVQPEYYQRALTQLNLIMTEMMAQGLHIASYRTATLFLQPDDYKVTPQTANCTNQYYSTTLSNSYTTGSTTLQLASVANITVGDYFGIMLDSNAIQWTTVSSKNTGASTVTIPAPGLTGAAASGNQCINYTTPVSQIVRLHQCWRRDNFVNDIPLTMISKQEYDALPYKTPDVAVGLPNQIYYERSLPYGTMYMWPPAQNSLSFINFWYETRLAQMMNANDVLALDQTYLPAVVKYTAYRLANSFGVGSELYMRIREEAKELMNIALSFDSEQTPFKISLTRES